MLLAQQSFSGINGFLGSRASLMLDVVFVALFALLPALAVSIVLVRKRRRYALHKKLQILLGSVLLIAVAAFEIDIRFFTNWRERAGASPYYSGDTWSPVWIVLAIHLCFAIPTALLWIWVIVQAVRRFPTPPAPGSHSRQHRLWGWAAAWGMLCTALTGWLFYWMAFVATGGVLS